MLTDLLFELGTEELPSGAVDLLSTALAECLVAAFSKAGITHGLVRRFATPRRLAVMIADVQAEQPSQRVVRRGPSVGSDAQAVAGFAKSCGVGIDALTQTTTDKGSWWVFESVKPGRRTRDLLPSLLTDSLASLPIMKPMRWGAGEVYFARPVHWAVLLWGDEVIPADVLGVKTGRLTYGHRYHHPQAIELLTVGSYEQVLNEACVIAEFDSRRKQIIEQVTALAARQGHVAVMPDALVDEVTSIVEWPNALLVNFEPDFLEVPAEALIAAMQSHQKCFALRDATGALVPQFITVSNIASRHPQQVVTGNENVMRARLSDADFFFRQDKKQPLSAYRAATEHVVFQQKLGSLSDKSRRMSVLMTYLSESLQLDVIQAQRAAYLSKCDLMTGMVSEFPELQGLMGYYYARSDGEDDAVSCALNEQYMPRFSSDELPVSSLGQALSLSDRIDTLVGAFAIGQRPTGVKDPFKLRRHALAVVRLLISISKPIRLSVLIEKSLEAYGDLLPERGTTQRALHAFILERLPSFYQGQGISTDIVHAVRACQDDDLCDLDRRVHAVLAFTRLPDAATVSAVCKRVTNLLQQTSVDVNHPVSPALFHQEAEKDLFSHMNRVEAQVALYYHSGAYGAILNQLACLRAPLDAFFDDVMVMVDDRSVRDNRLRLLKRLQQLLQGVADVSLLQMSA